ncbi:MAG: peptide-methionine (S)-S-oxide reductase MsrA [Oligoflexia bacterium]|nr:peptide-methionine (S)-S-oxide reductase MsrA [Oligoflexia bacterium]
MAAPEIQPKTDPSVSFGIATPAPADGLSVAIFAGGCFWCMEKPFDQLDGVISTTSGYTGGSEPAPSYPDVSGHRTGHAEAMRVVYDPTRTSYARLLDVYWHNVDPIQADGQFCDRGPQYRTGIFTSDPTQRALAEASKAALGTRLHAEIATEIVDIQPFWPAEDYHQDFYAKNPERYHSYRLGCGRDKRLRTLWGAAAGVGEGDGWVSAALGADLTRE